MKGQHRKSGVGVPSPSTPALNQTIFWLRVETKSKVIGQCVKFKDSRGSSLPRAVAVGPRLEVSEDYDGWFEILSEDGRSVKTIDSVAELAKRFPQKCLLREGMKASLTSKTDNGLQEVLSDKTRVLQAGDILSLHSIIASLGSKSLSDKYLKCLTSSGAASHADLFLFLFLDRMHSDTLSHLLLSLLPFLCQAKRCSCASTRRAASRQSRVRTAFQVSTPSRT